MTAPLVPADCDLTSLPWFRLHHKRLKQSEWWLSASDLARSRNVDLWCEAFEQIPAASLPDSDVVLARFAGYGRDVAGFRAVKAEIMGAWELCSDGRWYHPTLAEIALAAWSERLLFLWGRECDRIRKENRRREKDGLDPLPIPPRPAEIANFPPENAAASPEQSTTSAGSPPESTAPDPENDRKTLLDVEVLVEVDSPPPPEGGADEAEKLPEGLKPTPVSDEIAEAFRLWNETAERCGLPIAQDLTEPRRRALAKRLKPGGLDRWQEALAKVEVSAFLCGERPDKDGRTFRAHLDFVLQASRFQKLIEGTYRADRKPVRLQIATPVDPMAPWRHRVGEFTRNGYWNDCDWDARPGRPGCRAPPAVLAEFGFAVADVILLPTSDRTAA